MYLIFSQWNMSKINKLKKIKNINLVKSNKQINILIVDDNNYIRSLATSLLKKQDYNVISAADAFEAVELIKHYGVKFLDLIITDYQMPGMNGLDFVKKVKAKEGFENIPVILLSQHNNVFFKQNQSQEKLEIFDAVIHKTSIYKFLMQEVHNLLRK